MITFFPKAGPRYMTIMRKILVTNITLPLVFSYHFWRTWGDVIAPDGNSGVKYDRNKQIFNPADTRETP